MIDIFPTYSCLLGRPWIHEAGAVTSTLHQKLKFTVNGKLVTIIGEQALLISHLSSFSFITANDVEGTHLPGHPLEDESASKSRSSISSYKEAAQIVKDGNAEGWGRVIKPVNKETKAGLGFAPVFPNDKQRDEALRPIKEVFHSGGFLNPVLQEVNILTIEGDEDNLSGSEEWSSYLNSPEYVSQEESYASYYPPTDQFKGISLQQNGNPSNSSEVWDSLGEPSGKFDYMVKYSTPESSKIRIEDIQPTGWGDSFEYPSQPEEVYPSSRSNQPIEIPNEDLCSDTPVEFVKPDLNYHHINVITEDQGYDSGYELESVADNESLHSEDWRVHPQNSMQRPTESTLAVSHTSRSVHQAEEDRFSSTKAK